MKVRACRGCASEHVATLVDFGPQPLAGHFPLSPESVSPAKSYPLDLSQCTACGLLQVTHLPPIEEVFHTDYRYSSSTVPGLVRHFDEYAGWLGQRLAPASEVFEFGCNDGVLLERLSRAGFRCTGVDASENVASLARSKGLRVHTGFLTPEHVTRHQLAGRFDLVTCSNVFAHIHDLASMVTAVHMLLKANGLFAIEVHDGDVLLHDGQFDTIYHEHLTYFTESTLRALLERRSFEFLSCERTAMHGGGLRLLCRQRESATAFVPARANKASASAAVELPVAIDRCRSRLHELHAQFGPLDGFGAAGRSQMFINMTGSARLFARVFDDSPLRQGRFVAGTDVPIVPYAQDRGRCCVILAWNYAADIAKRLQQRYERLVTLLPQERSW